MASKKLKKALLAGLAGAAMAKMGQSKQMKEYLATEGGDKSSIVKSAVTKTKMLPKKKPSGSSYADVLGGYNDFGLGAMDGAKAGKMIKARGGKMVNLKPTKLY